MTDRDLDGFLNAYLTQLASGERNKYLPEMARLRGRVFLPKADMKGTNLIYE